MGQGLQHFKKMLQCGNQTLAAVNFVKYDYLQQIGYKCTQIPRKVVKCPCFKYFCYYYVFFIYPF